MAVIEVTPEGLRLKEVAEDTTIDAVRAATEPALLADEPLPVF
jgi:acyl CoA:acetate/3-ketoacid CoA transferase beta subunit